jgi:LysR family transcriptional regulator, nitrogen assimilation regulatory protein
MMFSEPGAPMKIYVNSIRYFLAVCEERSFCGAAKNIGISQPTLSQAIHRLEKALGGRLLERSLLGTTGLTDLGRSLLPHFRKLERCLDRMELAARTAIAEGGQSMPRRYAIAPPPQISPESRR